VAQSHAEEEGMCVNKIDLLSKIRADSLIRAVLVSTHESKGRIELVLHEYRRCLQHRFIHYSFVNGLTLEECHILQLTFVWQRVLQLDTQRLLSYTIDEEL
jgi:hypothetical protein